MFTCPLCGFKTVRLVSMALHLSLIHKIYLRASPQYECCCGQVFDENDGLVWHLEHCDLKEHVMIAGLKTLIEGDA